jgi:6-phosphogluconolactonase
LIPHEFPSIATEPGAGPRHLEFHPNGRYLYVTNELNSTIGVYDYDAGNGTLKHKQSISAVPDDFVGTNSLADIHITQSGLFLYVSNRGHDSIAVFVVDPDQGYLTPVETVSSGGQTPRNFALDPSNNFLLVANQESHNLIVFQIDKRNGRLTQTDLALSIPSPVCVKFIEVNRT